MAKSLVTGGAGFLGSHLATDLLQRGHDVVVMDDLSGGFVENLPPSAQFFEGSVSDADHVQELFDKHSFDTVYHLAAYAAEGLSHFIKNYNYTNNVIGSVNLINASVNSGVDCFVFTSSIAVYGAGQLPLREDAIPLPEDSYGIAKRAVEMELEASARMFGLRYVIFRPHNVYGELQNIGDRYRNVIGIFMNQIMSGEPLTIFGDGSQTRAFTYVADIVPVLARAADVPEARNETFNVGASQPYSVLHLAEVVREAMGVPGHPINFLDARDEVLHAFSDHSKVAAVFGEAEETSLTEGVSRMADWAQDVGPRATTPFAAIEIAKNLPPSWRTA